MLLTSELIYATFYSIPKHLLMTSAYYSPPIASFYIGNCCRGDPVSVGGCT